MKRISLKHPMKCIVRWSAHVAVYSQYHTALSEGKWNWKPLFFKGSCSSSSSLLFFAFFFFLLLLEDPTAAWYSKEKDSRRKTNYGTILMTRAFQAYFICMKPRTLCVWPDWETQDLTDWRNNEQLFCDLSVSMSTCDVWSLAQSGRPTLTIPREY